MSEPVHVLFVCSANLCRSVTAAEYARRAAQSSLSNSVSWHFESAGTEVSRGQRLPPDVASTMEMLGIPLRDRPLAVTEAHVRSADLILTAERHHRSVIAQRFPFAVRYVFTLLQFARLIGAAGPTERPIEVSNAADLLRLARIGQSSIDPLADDTIDIGDPVVARSSTAMLNCARVVEAAVQRIVV
jgi:protein-tyrosine-phosphatase